MGIFSNKIKQTFTWSSTTEPLKSSGKQERNDEAPRVPLSERAHWLESNAVIRKLRTSTQDGLTDAEASTRLQQMGENALTGDGGVSAWKVLVRQMANALTLVLVAAMALSYGVQDWIEGAVITAVIVINVCVGFFQEYRAEQTMDSLRSLSSPTALVIRGGEAQSVPAKYVVPGDICMIKTGDVVPADMRLISVSNLEIDEALLTGEAMPVNKTIESLHSSFSHSQPSPTKAEKDITAEHDNTITTTEYDTEHIPVGDRVNLAFASSVVTKGRGKGVVIATGMETQVGRIALAMQRKKNDNSHRDNLSAEETKTPIWKRVLNKIMEFLGLRSGTPLQIKLSKTAYLLFLFAVLLAIIVFAVAKFDVTNEVAIYAIALGIAVIPESLIAVLTITMSAGTARMAKSHVIVRQLHALEALGSITDICSDKTGTLTAGKMLVRKFWLPSSSSSASTEGEDNVSLGDNSRSFTVESGSEVLEPAGHVYQDTTEEREKEGAKVSREGLDEDNHLKEFVLCASLCNVATVYKNKEGKWTSTGDPTEVALQVFATKLGQGRPDLATTAVSQEDGETPAPVQLHDEKQPFDAASERRFYLLHEFPFDSTVKRMSTVYVDRDGSGENEIVVYLKGAVERVLDASTHIFGGATSISEEYRQEILSQTESLASQGLRVLALASRRISRNSLRRGAGSQDESSQVDLVREEIEQEFGFIGLAGIYDPPRPESVHAIRACKQAGITVHMLTGDHQATATAIAREIEIVGKDAPPSAIMPATRFNKLTDAEIDALPELPLVIARCDPDTKVRMIEAGARRNLYMTMTGDGVNDAPSLKLAPVGIGMGEGSDVAKDASELVLTDNNFDSIRAAISEGRRIFDNIQRFVIHLLSTNVAEVVLLIISLAFFDRTRNSVYPLSPLSILWINMVTSGPPAFGLGLEPPAVDVMTRPPHDVKSGIFSLSVIIDCFVYGLAMGATTLMSFVIVVWGKNDGELGQDCNRKHSAECDVVFRGRSTVFATLTFQILLYAWELKSLNRSLFSIRPGHPFYKDLWRNQLLFWAVVLGCASVPICIYVPGLNTSVFYQSGISWEWGIVVGMTFVFLATVELWKLLARPHLTRFLARRN